MQRSYADSLDRVVALGASQTSRLETGGAVQSVAFSPQGDLLAIGLGMYPLDPNNHQQAAIELFSTANPSGPLVRRVLPGVAVDRVVFHPTRELLVAVTGARVSRSWTRACARPPHSRLARRSGDGCLPFVARR